MNRSQHEVVFEREPAKNQDETEILVHQGDQEAFSEMQGHSTHTGYAPPVS